MKLTQSSGSRSILNVLRYFRYIANCEKMLLPKTISRPAKSFICSFLFHVPWFTVILMSVSPGKVSYEQFEAIMAEELLAHTNQEFDLLEAFR